MQNPTQDEAWIRWQQHQQQQHQYPLPNHPSNTTTPQQQPQQSGDLTLLHSHQRQSHSPPPPPPRHHHAPSPRSLEHPSPFQSHHPHPASHPNPPTQRSYPIHYPPSSQQQQQQHPHPHHVQHTRPQAHIQPQSQPQPHHHPPHQYPHMQTHPAQEPHPCAPAQHPPTPPYGSLALQRQSPVHMAPPIHPPPDQQQQQHHQQHPPPRTLEHSMTPGIPTTHVGKYTLYGTIGEGAFGKVKLGVNRETNERVAVKIMDKKEIREQDLSAQVRREIYIMRSLRHKHIVRMYEVLTSDTKLYIVMELVTGGELFERLEKHGRVDEALARHYFQQLVDGVDFCHKHGVAHRDLKPENLLLDANGDIKITDFGFSSMRGVDVNTGLLYTQCGTPDYCAPEIIERAEEGYNGAKVDVWSCGIILYALLVGALPFQEQETDRLYDLILACDVQYPPIISSSAKDLLCKLLVRDPAKRLTIAEIKRHDWFLLDYNGDDARILKKPAFYNKNTSHGGSRSSTPSGSGRATPRKDSPSQAQFRDVDATNSDWQGPTSAQALSQPSEHAQPVLGSGTDHDDESEDQVPDSVVEAVPASSDLTARKGDAFQSVMNMSHDFRNNRTTPSSDSSLCGDNTNPNSGVVHTRDDRDQDNSMAAGLFPENGSSAVNIHPTNGQNRNMNVPTPATGRVAALIRAHENQNGTPEAPNSGSYSVFTRVEDRPATPAMKPPVSPTRPPSILGSHSRQVTAHGNPSDSERVISVPPTTSGFPMIAHGVSRAIAENSPNLPPRSFQGSVLNIERSVPSKDERQFEDVPGDFSRTNLDLSMVDVGRDIESSDEDEGDSVEDYQSKPVPTLNLPTTERFMRHQTAQEIRPEGGIPQPIVQRHRSDASAHVNSQLQVSRPTNAPASSSLAAHVPAFGTPNLVAMRSNSPSHAVMSGGISARTGSPFRRPLGPSSPGVGQVEFRSSLLANRNNRVLPENTSRPVTSPVSSSSSAAGPHGGTAPVSPFLASHQSGSLAGGSTIPTSSWNDQRTTARSNSEELPNPSRQLSSDTTWFGPHTEQLSRRMWNMFARWRVLADEPMSPHASQELRMEFRAIQSEIAVITDPEERLSVYQHFMTLFAKFGLSDVTAGRGDDDGSELNMRTAGVQGRRPTDMSSEEDGGSWSPTVVYEGSRNKSDFARRREMSDLLTKWIGKLSTPRENTGDDVPESDDGGSNSVDVAEMQRLLRQYHGGRDDSNLAEEFERLMKTPEIFDAGGHSLSGTGADAPLSLSNLPSTRTRSGDTYVQHTRWGTGAASLSNGPASLPSAPRVNRSMAPADYVPGSFSDIAMSGKADSAIVKDKLPDELRTNRATPRAREEHSSLGGSSGVTGTAQISKRSGRKQPDMASSMGLDNVEYYGSDRRGMSYKVKNVLQHMKRKNQRLVESSTWFSSSYEPESILVILNGILEHMGATVALKRETRRKMRVRLQLSQDVALVAGIELTVLEDGLTKVSFRRSRADRGRTDTLAFTEFYETVREQFIAEVQARGARHRRSGNQAQPRRPESHPNMPAVHEVPIPVQSDTQYFGDNSSVQTQSFGRAKLLAPGTKGTVVRSAPRAASDMR